MLGHDLAQAAAKCPGHASLYVLWWNVEYLLNLYDDNDATSRTLNGEQAMFFFVIGMAMGIGAMLGVFTSIEEGVGLMLVMGVIGAAFSGAIAGGLCAVVRAVTHNTSEGYSQDQFATSALEEGVNIDPAGLIDIAIKWSDEKERFPISGDPELISRVKSGSPDLTNLNRHNGF